MKKILSILGAITLIGTSSSSVIACNKNEYTAEELKELKEKNKINTKDKTIRDNLEWMASQETPFNKIDNKWYYVVWNDRNEFVISKFKNDKDNNHGYDPAKSVKIDIKNQLKLKLGYLAFYKKINLFVYANTEDFINNGIYPWKKGNEYFKSVYRWNLDTPAPDLILDKDGNIKVKGE